MNKLDLEKKVKSLVNLLRYEKGFVCTVDILLRINYISKKDYENWRFGRIDYLEKVCNVNLSKLTLINKTIRKAGIDLKLDKSWTEYKQYGKGMKRRLRFSKSGNENIEKAYATHYIDRNRINELKNNNASV